MSAITPELVRTCTDVKTVKNAHIKTHYKIHGKNSPQEKHVPLTLSLVSSSAMENCLLMKPPLQ